MPNNASSHYNSPDITEDECIDSRLYPVPTDLGSRRPLQRSDRSSLCPSSHSTHSKHLDVSTVEKNLCSWGSDKSTEITDVTESLTDSYGDFNTSMSSVLTFLEYPVRYVKNSELSGVCNDFSLTENDDEESFAEDSEHHEPTVAAVDQKNAKKLGKKKKKNTPTISKDSNTDTSKAKKSTKLKKKKILTKEEVFEEVEKITDACTKDSEPLSSEISLSDNSIASKSLNASMNKDSAKNHKATVPTGSLEANDGLKKSEICVKSLPTSKILIQTDCVQVLHDTNKDQSSNDNAYSCQATATSATIIHHSSPSKISNVEEKSKLIVRNRRASIGPLTSSAHSPCTNAIISSQPLKPVSQSRQAPTHISTIQTAATGDFSKSLHSKTNGLTKPFKQARRASIATIGSSTHDTLDSKRMTNSSDCDKYSIPLKPIVGTVKTIEAVKESPVPNDNNPRYAPPETNTTPHKLTCTTTVPSSPTKRGAFITSIDEQMQQIARSRRASIGTTRVSADMPACLSIKDRLKMFQQGNN